MTSWDRLDACLPGSDGGEEWSPVVPLSTPCSEARDSAVSFGSHPSLDPGNTPSLGHVYICCSEGVWASQVIQR